MIFKKFNSNHIEDAAKLALSKYNREQKNLECLPEMNSCDFLCPIIEKMSKNELGFVATEGNNLIGFICGYGLLENYFGTSDGIFCPIEGHGTIEGGSYKIYSRLYQKAADFWVSQGLLSHVVALYAHDISAVDSFFHNGFGLRCVDAMAPLKAKKLPVQDKYTFRLADENDYSTIAKFESNLTKHLRQSPMFMPRNPFIKAKDIKKDADSGDSFYVVQESDKVLGFIKLSETAENFASDNMSVKNICGAYLIPEYRQNGIFDLLLIYVSNLLIEKGYKSLGVDYESFNPLANAYWQKHFTPYTYSVARRIDERIYPIKKL